MNSLTPQEALKTLRERAEARRLATKSLPASAPADAQRLVQELQMHQIELEMQYEELLLAQADAEASRARYQDLYEFAPVGYGTLDDDNVLTELNLSLAQLLGEPRGRLLGRQLPLFADPAERPHLHDCLTRMRQAPGQRHTCEVLMHRHAGAPFYAELVGVATAADEVLGRPASCRVMLLDVTARRQATAALAASEARFRATFEQSRDGMLLLDGPRLADANNAALLLLGQADKAEVLGHALVEFWPETQPDGRRSLDLLTRCLERARVTGWCRQEWQRPGPDGQPRWDELSFNPVLMQGRALMHAAWRDVTERKRTEQHLTASRARLERALAAGHAGVWTWDLASGLVETDARAQAIFGVAGPSTPFAELQARIHPADQASVAVALAEARRAGTGFELAHRMVLPPDGQVRYVAAHGQFEYGPDGGATCLAGLVRDVTARQQAQAELHARDLLLQNVLHSMPVLLARLGPDGCYREHIGRALHHLGLGQNELVGRHAEEVFPASAPHFRRLLAGESVSYVTELPGAGGEPVFLQVSGFFNPEQQEAVLFGLDITEPEQLKAEAARQHQRQQQELHAAVLSTQEEERRRISESLHNGLGQLLYATRLHLDRLTPSEAVRASQQLLSEAIRATRNISFELTPTIVEEFGLGAALRELVRRVPAGAFTLHLHERGLGEAMPPRLATATYRIVQELLNNVMKHAQAREVFLSVAREADQLYLTLEDDGVGFDPAAATTQGVGLAGIRTRLGLLGGTFELQSRPGHGTNVALQLPLAD